MIRAAIFYVLAFCLPLTASIEKNRHPVLFFIGTRPEAIKLLPLHLAFKEAGIATFLCSTGQHNELLNPIFDLFKTQTDTDFAIMKKDQDLFYITESVLQRSKLLMKELEPSLVIVQGDTTTAMAAAMAAFYLKIPIVHIEAGLRTYNINRPFPEEMNRRIISLISSYHFAPTSQAAARLVNEGVKQDAIFLTGNTVVDGLLMIRQRIAAKEILPSEQIVKLIEQQKSLNRKLMVLTAHRRELLADGSILNIFRAVSQALNENSDLFVIFPVHPNPQIRIAIEKSGLDQMPNLFLAPPLPYQDMVYLLSAADLIATDSGGIQEEGVCLHKPVLVLRNETDRPEGLEGSAILVGTEVSNILLGIKRILENEQNLGDGEDCIYGDGQACKRITEIIKGLLEK